MNSEESMQVLYESERVIRHRLVAAAMVKLQELESHEEREAQMHVMRTVVANDATMQRSINRIAESIRLFLK